MVTSKDRPFFSAVKERYRLTGPGSQKDTWHVVLDLAGSGIRYGAGDCLAIIPANAPELVERTLAAAKLQDGNQVVCKRTSEILSIREFFTHKASITHLNKRIVRYLAELEPNGQLAELLLEQNREQLGGLLEEYELWDLLEAFPTKVEAQGLCDYLQPLLPRFYSIASSQKVVGDEVHLTVRHVAFTSRERRRHGVCTHQLCYLAPLGEPILPVYIQPADSFVLPANSNQAIVMVGPGTGVAPYRAFLQERHQAGSRGANWLFFGEWTRKNEFLYEEYWTALAAQGFLRLTTAFSRDQQEKFYVQHRMLEESTTLWQWIDEGAHFYVCGDAKRMAKDVDAALHQIVEENGKFSPTGAREYVRTMRREKRYLTDVY